MTLDPRIHNDLGDIYNKLPIKSAVDFNIYCKLPKNSHPFSTHGLPTHYTGDRDAKTILVMQNPGREKIRMRRFHISQVFFGSSYIEPLAKLTVE